MLFVTILTCIPFAMWLMGKSAQAEFGADAAASTLLVPNIFYGFQDSYWSAPGKLRPLLHLWTIGVEMQFYFLCPIIFLAIKRWVKPVLGLSVISALSFAAAIWLSRSHPGFAFYNLPTRLWEFGFGALIFYTPRPKINVMALTPLGLGLILASFIFLNETIMHPAGLTLLPVIGSCLVIMGGKVSDDNILANPTLRRIGLISFSAYLIHQPLFAFTRIATNQIDLPALTSLGLIIMTLVLSELTYRFIETPLRKPFKKRAAVTGLLGVFALIGALYLLQSNAKMNANTEALLIKPERWILNAADTRCVNKEITHPCRIGNSETKPSIALLGDSHMQAMAGGFDEFFKAQNLNDIDYSMGGCPFIMGVTRYARKYPCDEFVEQAFKELSAREIKTVIILDRRNAYLLGTGATYNDGTKEPADTRIYPVSLGPDANETDRITEIERLHLATIQRLRDMNIKIILIYPVPEIGIHVPDTLVERVRTGELPLTLDLNLHQARQAPLKALKTLAANDSGIMTIDPADIFCETTICRTHNASEIYYTDRDHLSRAGTDLFLQTQGSSILSFVESSAPED